MLNKAIEKICGPQGQFFKRNRFKDANLGFQSHDVIFWWWLIWNGLFLKVREEILFILFRINSVYFKTYIVCLFFKVGRSSGIKQRKKSAGSFR